MNKLSPVIIETDCIDRIIDTCHEKFKTDLASKENRPRLGERYIYIPFSWMEDRKSEIFWHIASIETKKDIPILPCTNDIASAICQENCLRGDKLVYPGGNERAACIFRAMRVNWISRVVEMYNCQDKRVKYWEKRNSSKMNRIYLRYQEKENDFLIVFEEKSGKKVQLITAFPIFYRSAKRDYDRDYEAFRKKKNKQ